MYMISVIVLTFRSEWEKLKLTLESILIQEYCDYEIVIADDASDIDNFDKLKSYFRKKNFSSYKLIKSKKNGGTVKNFYNAARSCEGRYCKPLGVGDLLFDRKTLKGMIAFMERNNCDCAFGLMQSYHRGRFEEIRFSYYTAPRNTRVYEKRRRIGCLINNLVFHDTISGVCFIYRTSALIPKLQPMLGRIRFCEDCVQKLFLLEGDIFLINRYLVLYEYGTGISTDRESEFKKRLVEDHEAMDQYIFSIYKKNIFIKTMKKYRFVYDFIINNDRMDIWAELWDSFLERKLFDPQYRQRPRTKKSLLEEKTFYERFNNKKEERKTLQ